MTSPRVFLEQQVDVLLDHLPVARDADAGSIHTARVATRRLREALPLFVRSYPGEAHRLTAFLRRVGRRLGRVRELNVMDGSIARLPVRPILAASALAVPTSWLLVASRSR